MKTSEIIELVNQRFAGVDENTKIWPVTSLSVTIPHDRGRTEFNAKLYQVGTTIFVADYDDKNNILAWWGCVQMGIEKEDTASEDES